MPRVSPFQGLVFDAASVGPLERVTAPPYDVISEDRRRELLDANPFSVVHLDLGDGPDDPAHPQSRYTQAGDRLREWESNGVLVRTPSSYFGYEMAYETDGKTGAIRGLLAAMDLEPWGGSVVPHEEVMHGPVQDRLHLLRATHAHVSPIYGTIAGPCAPLAEALLEAPSGAHWEVTDEQDVRHRLWALDPAVDIASALRDEPLLIADGHHRYTTALAYRDEQHAVAGPGPWDRILTLIVDATAERLPVLPFHRIQVGGAAPTAGEPVADLAAALAALSDDDLRIATATRDDEGAAHYRVLTLAGDPPAVRALQDGPLHEAAFTGALRYVSDAGIADSAVRSGKAMAAWFLPPTTPERIRSLAARGERLPEKSTYFWPKPRTGMVMMPLGSRPVEVTPGPARAS